jgi:xanthine dehydrogenase YagS FAD-binding subunit
VKFVRDITVLLVIDPYNDFISEGGQFWPHVKSVAEATSGSKHLYLKLRARASYEFASASAAVMLTISSGNITRARIVACGVGTKPTKCLFVDRLSGSDGRGIVAVCSGCFGSGWTR